MRLLSSYAPRSFSKKCIIFSTCYSKQLRETAFVLVQAINSDHALQKMYGNDEKYEWKPIKKHKTLDSASKFHVNLAKKMRNGGTDKEWEKSDKIYYKIIKN